MNDMRVEVFDHLILPFDMRSTGHRNVNFWHAYVEPFTIQNKSVNGVYFLEQCHVLIEPDQRTFSNEVFALRDNHIPFFRSKIEGRSQI
ncbi:ATP-binding cassette (ABC) Superfamily [Phytophthora palmivora]|uniref:ATP-binding cassette (ABC) Superfamily n=1 Tax=Phytophthora palmivora TaxID=4796 RepID=A0A2P4X284_9STRA|nr:ATP-binding cassette (ABC) Superfamily [Phytophthora palmivora]